MKKWIAIVGIVCLVAVQTPAQAFEQRVADEQWVAEISQQVSPSPDKAAGSLTYKDDQVQGIGTPQVEIIEDKYCFVRFASEDLQMEYINAWTKELRGLHSLYSSQKANLSDRLMWTESFSMTELRIRLTSDLLNDPNPFNRMAAACLLTQMWTGGLPVFYSGKDKEAMTGLMLAEKSLEKDPQVLSVIRQILDRLSPISPR